MQILYKINHQVIQSDLFIPSWRSLNLPQGSRIRITIPKKVTSRIATIHCSHGMACYIELSYSCHETSMVTMVGEKSELC